PAAAGRGGGGPHRPRGRPAGRDRPRHQRRGHRGHLDRARGACAHRHGEPADLPGRRPVRRRRRAGRGAGQPRGPRGLPRLRADRLAQRRDHGRGSDRGRPVVSEPKARGGDWTEERGTSDEGRSRLESGPEASEVSRGSEPLLEVRDLTVHHGQLRALDRVSLRVFPGEVYAIIGANGAGKSTLLRTIAGLHRPTDGAILYDGKDMTKIRPERRATGGIVMVPEGRRLFGSLTVEENLKV